MGFKGRVFRLCRRVLVHAHREQRIGKVLRDTRFEFPEVQSWVGFVAALDTEPLRCTGELIAKMSSSLSFQLEIIMVDYMPKCRLDIFRMQVVDDILERGVAQ